MPLDQGEKDALRATMAERSKARKKMSPEDLEGEVLAVIAKIAPQDRSIAHAIHLIVKKHAPNLQAKTWYSMQAYADAQGRTVLFFQDAAKFKSRYATLGFQPAAKLDDGKMWATSYAILEWNEETEACVIDLVLKAARQH